MVVWLSIGVISVITSLYLGRKGWHALHKAVGISPGTLIYQHPDAPLSLPDLTWQQLILDQKYLRVLSDAQLRQLKRFDDKMLAYQQYQRELDTQNSTRILTEEHYMLQKWLEVRLPQMLTSYYHAQLGIRDQDIKGQSINTAHTNRLTASQLLQEGLDNIEQLLDNQLAQIEIRHVQELQIMQRYMSEHNHTRL